MHIRLAALARRTAAHAGFLAALALVAGSPAAGADGERREVRIDAVTVAGAPAIQGPMRMQIWARDGGGKFRKIGESERVPAHVRLQPGRYRVVLHYREVRAVRDIVVDEAGDAHKTLSLRAGEVGLELLRAAGGGALHDGVSWRVHRYRKGDEAGKPVAQRSEPTPTLLLSEGWYEVVATHGNRRVSHVIEVSAGQRYDYSLVAD